MKMQQDEIYNFISLIRTVFWGDDSFAIPSVSDAIFEELRIQAVAALPAPILSELDLSSELYNKWKKEILQHIAYNAQYKYEQETLPVTVPYVILKGTESAKYYPYPEYRLMGDIDIMPAREDFDEACQQLLGNGYQLIKKLEREKGFVKNGVIVEVHRYFASLNDPVQAAYLDNLILDNINETHVLPDLVNGLVLLEHISQHLENGLGLRQIIDWMMFVDKCLPDEKWSEFREMAKSIGMEMLAITVTHMCEMYLGLPSRKWCAVADEKLCDQLMEYVLSNGDFGNKRHEEDDIGANVFLRMRSRRTFRTLLQERGLVNWKAAQRYRFLRPFAWCYQLGRYAVKGFGRDGSWTKLKEEYKASCERYAMFEKLGVKLTTKGLVVYKDGKYIKQ